jgi:hypothetical protein
MTKLLRAGLSLALGAAVLAVHLPTPADAQRRGGGSGGYKVRSHPPAPAYRGPVVRHRRGGGVAAGIAAGVAGAIIINELARRQSSPSYYYYDRSPGMSCYELERRCDDGQEWACHRLDRDPNC